MAKKKLRSQNIHMLATSVLVKKRLGQELSDDEIRFLIEGFCDGRVADYQMAALAMAICLNGMNPREIATLTRAMLESGEALPRVASNHGDRPRVDKHSTGGLGDKVSLILAPMLAVCDVDVPMISGRGLGLTGGTLDKLEAIEGYQTQMSIDDSSRILQEVGCFIVGASESVAPADRKLYALRDVTGTVDSTALITASILSKKLAASLDALAMDVKVGEAAFMKTFADAETLAKSLIRVGEQAGLPTSVIISDMDQPLGETIGNAIEVNESVEVLQGGGPADVRELTVQLCANVLVEVNAVKNRDEAIAKLQATLDDGSAMEKFEQWISAQGGKLKYPLKLAPKQEILAEESGYLERYDCTAIGEAVVSMGGGREQVDAEIDPSVGIQLHAKVGDAIAIGQPIMTAYFHERANDPGSNYPDKLRAAATITSNSVSPRPLILQRLAKEDLTDVE